VHNNDHISNGLCLFIGSAVRPVSGRDSMKKENLETVYGLS